MPQTPRVRELGQRLGVLQGLVDVPAGRNGSSVGDLVLDVPPQLRGFFADHLGHVGLRGPVCLLRWHHMADQQIPVALHPSLLRVLKHLEVLGAVRAGLGQQDVVPARVTSQQRLQVVDAVVDDHVRLLGSVVLGNLGTGEERQVLASRDLRQLREAALLRQGRRIRLARHLHGRLHRLDLLLGGPLKASQLVVQLAQLHDDGVHWLLRADLAGLELRAHVVLHPLLAGEPARNLVPHRRGVAARPRQDGVALLWVVHQEVCEVVHAPVDGDPTIVRLVVTRNLRQGDAPAQVL
mmetsp:Transcript_42978/g.102421  ORF Transcript_42978/g.102421 Transcript_42978/m.102421 type:complete len:294 (-) Transcript_42978:725-1606(-)